MTIIRFSERDIKRAKFRVAKPDPIRPKIVKKRDVFHCSIDGYVLRIGRYKVNKTWAIKFAKWILRSFGDK